MPRASSEALSYCRPCGDNETAVTGNFRKHSVRPFIVQVPLSEEEEAAQKAKPEKMAIGGDGGFQVENAMHRTSASPSSGHAMGGSLQCSMEVLADPAVLAERRSQDCAVFIVRACRWK